MNKEIYLLYIRAQPKVKEYQQRLKTLWDENFLEFNQMTSRHLAQQAGNIKMKKLVSGLDMQLIEQRVNRTIETQIKKPEPQEPEKEQEQEREAVQEGREELTSENLTNEEIPTMDPGTEEYLTQR